MKIWERDYEEPTEWDLIKNMEEAVNNDCTLTLKFNVHNEKCVYIDNVKIELIK